MSFMKRASLYILRKKGKTFGIFLLIAVVSTFLVSCVSILNAADILTADIRKSIGAAFYLRANSSVTTKKGELSIEKNNINITDNDIAKIEKYGDIAYCNPINYGYAKSEEIVFIPGKNDNLQNNMGQVTALRYSALHADFAEKVISLQQGEHIIKTSEKAIIVSSEIAEKNNLSVGDNVILQSAEFGVENSEYIDVWKKDKKTVEVSIVGIYEILVENTSATATAAKQENRIYASLDVLLSLGESEASVYTGEVDFYVADPDELSEIVPKVRQIAEIDWKTHFIRTNDFEYSKISDRLKSLSNLIKVLFVCVSVVSAAILTLILTFGARSRVQESGIFLAVGISKKEVLMQFLFETLTVALTAFVFSYISYLAIQEGFTDRLFADISSEVITNAALENGADASLKDQGYLSLGIGKILTVYSVQFFVIAVSILFSSRMILRLKPKKILQYI